ncbi:hypothetical protein NC651_027496 [Populus alba x Populus x berolinensis]|nr:hypothetical protein NC651_027496 [Populus alba x Populus x berolinensis]
MHRHLNPVKPTFLLQKLHLFATATGRGHCLTLLISY